MRAQRVIGGKRLGSIQDGAFRDEGSARCCSSQSVLTALTASQGRWGYGKSRRDAVFQHRPVDSARGTIVALLPPSHSSKARDLRFSVDRGARAAVSRPPSSATTAGVWSGTGTKAAAILSPPPPVSLFPQSLSLFPSLRQLSRTCTTQREPCVVALPIAALPARYPRPSSHKLSGLC